MEKEEEEVGRRNLFIGVVGGGLKKMMIIVHTEFKFATKCGLSTILDR